jgi:hypothetical protein
MPLFMDHHRGVEGLTAEVVKETLPNSRIVVMPGQVHAALATPAPSYSRPRC